MPSRPNIIFMLADQHNAKVIGHKGHANVKTPNLDRMAAEGTRFDNAVTQNPICTPSRVSWLSGQYCHNHGYYGLSGPNPNGLPTVLGHFRDRGYTTAAIGKIHCPEYWVEDDSDVFHETCGCSIGGRSKAYTAFLKEHGKDKLEDHGSMPEFGARGQQSMEGRPSPLSFEESQEGWIASTGIDFMKQAAADNKPFFAHLSFPRPHQCTSPSQEFWDLYEGEELQLPPNADSSLEGKAPHMRRQAENWRKGEWALLEPKTFEEARLRKLRGYLAAISQVDHAVGQVLEFLDREGLSENTIVIYSADHGDYACEHGIMEKAPGISSDAITRIPYLWRCPGTVAAGHVATDIVETVDMAATVCALAGLDPMGTRDGDDLSALLKGETGDTRGLGVTEFPWSRSLRKGNYRLVYWPPEMFADDYPDGFGELYDLDADPWELKNLYFDPDYAGVVRELERDLLDWLVTTTRATTIHTPARLDDDPQAVTRYHNSVYADGKVGIREVRAVTNRNYT